MEPKLDDKTLLLKIIEPDGSVQTTSELKTGSDGGFKHQLIFGVVIGNWLPFGLAIVTTNPQSKSYLLL